MIPCLLLACVTMVVLSCNAINLQTRTATHFATSANKSVEGANAAFMLVAGVSAAEEHCLVVSAGTVLLDSCSNAVAAGDGRELWSFLGGGQLMHVASKKCASETGTSLVMAECGAATAWKMLPNGQVQVGGKCLSQLGVGAGTENAAIRAAAIATSAANAAHAAAAAVDTDDATFWASRPGDAGPVVLTVDLGEKRIISLMKISWEFPAQSFVVSSSLDGEHWTEVFSTTVNMVKASRIPFGRHARAVRVEMRKPHPVDGTLSGQAVYGIRSLSLLAPRLGVTLEDCATASQTKDARDKYFASQVSDFDPAAADPLRAEVPALAAAKASLSAALSEVVGVYRKLPGCQSDQAFTAKSAHAVGLLTAGPQSSSLLTTSGRSGRGDIADMNGIDEADVKVLLASARSAIVAVRDALM